MTRSLYTLAVCTAAVALGALSGLTAMAIAFVWIGLMAMTYKFSSTHAMNKTFDSVTGGVNMWTTKGDWTQVLPEFDFVHQLFEAIKEGLSS